MKESFNIYHHFAGVFLPSWLHSLSGVSAGAKLTYAVLAQQANSRGTTQLNFRMLEGALGESEGQLSRYLLELEGVNLIHTKRGNVNTEDVRIFFPQHDWFSKAGEGAGDASAAPDAGAETQARLFAAEPARAQATVKQLSAVARPASRQRKRKRWFGRPRSRHTLETCLAFITYQKNVLGRQRIYNPQGLAESIFYTGEQDGEIDDWLSDRADVA